MKPRLRRREHS